MAAVSAAAIIVDFDDTLVHSHELFVGIEAGFCALMRQLGLYDEALSATVRALDIEYVEQAGYLAADCFPHALGETYTRYCQKYGREAQDELREQIVELGWKAYSDIPRAVAGAHQLLAALRARRSHRLILFTQGEQRIQHNRVMRSGVAQYFDAIHIVQHKNLDSLRQLLREEQVDVAVSWYIGNSLRSDINPAVQAGLKAVHFVVPGWEYENQPPCGEYHTVDQLQQFLTLLETEDIDSDENCGGTV